MWNFHITQSLLMHKFYCFILLIVLFYKPTQIAGQTNHIINGSFEQYTTCVNGFRQVNKAIGWSEPGVYPFDNRIGEELRFYSQYFNQCFRSPITGSYPYGVPHNQHIFNKYPKSGNGYAVFSPLVIYRDNFWSPLKSMSTYLQGSVSLLNENRIYYFEMYIALAFATSPVISYSSYASGHIGVLFSDTAMPDIHSSDPLHGLEASIIDTNLIGEWFGWHKIKGIYKAKGNEKHFFIGAYELDTFRIWTPSSWNAASSSYFVDDVSLIDCNDYIRKDFLGKDTLLCNNAPFKLDARQPQGEVTYLWQDNSTKDTLMATQTGIYWAQVSVNGCPPFRDSIFIDREIPPAVNLGPDTIICLGKGFFLHSTPILQDTAYRYVWNTKDTSAVLYVDSVGKYNLTISKRGCGNTDSINIYKFPLKEFNLGSDTAHCTNNPVMLDATTAGAQHYLWSTTDTMPVIGALQSGLYWAEASNGTCQYRDSVNLIIKPQPVVELGNFFSDICDNINQVLDAGNPGAKYAWNLGDTTRLLPVTTPGFYKVMVNLNGCTVSDSIQISIVPAAVVNLGPDTLVCEGTQRLLDATTAGATYLWHDFTSNATYLATTQGWYKVKVTKGKCVTIDSVHIDITPKPIFTLGNDTAVCFEVPVIFDAGAANADAYLWQDNTTAPSYTATKEELVWVEVTKAACIVRDSVQLTQLPLALPNLGPDTFFCKGETYLLNPGNFVSYLWSDNSIASQLIANKAGLYHVVVKNNDGCSGNDQINLTEKSLPQINFGIDSALCEPNFLLSPGQGFIQYQWQDGSTTPQIPVTDYGTYKVTITDQFGCKNEGQITISNNCPTEIFVPNAFTPNTDGTNDIFMPVTFNVKSITMKIYDRWGKLIFESNETQKGWDGKWAGNFVMSDVYVYVINYTDLRDITKVLTGNVTLLR